MSEVAPEILQAILQHLRAAVSPDCYQSWFKDLSVLHLEGDTLHLAAPNRFVRQWLESHYRAELLRAAGALMPEIRKISISVSRKAGDSSVALSKVLDHALPPAAKSAGETRAEARPRETLRLQPLLARHRLENFIVGKCNRIAHAAALNVAESPGTVYNPLFIHGGHGLGKTHLLHGIGHLLMEQTPQLNVICVSCEEFTNAYINAVQNKRLDSFRSRFRNCDALLVDDVQFLGGREKTQEEFLHTFDALRNAHKQIVLCSDAAPREIKRLDPKLVTRFQAELVARMDAPDTPTRIALIREKARGRGLALGNDAAETLAAHITNNVRELEGAVCKLLALSSADSHDRAHGNGHSAPGRELALAALRDLGYVRTGPVTLHDVLSAVSAHYQISADDMRSGKRLSALVHARHIGMYLSRMLTAQSTAEIGRFYGNRDHATVLHACRKIAELLKRDENAQHEIKSLKQVLGR